VEIHLGTVCAKELRSALLGDGNVDDLNPSMLAASGRLISKIVESLDPDTELHQAATSALEELEPSSPAPRR
jgi:hypothetical protein